MKIHSDVFPQKLGGWDSIVGSDWATCYSFCGDGKLCIIFKVNTGTKSFHWMFIYFYEISSCPELYNTKLHCSGSWGFKVVKMVGFEINLTVCGGCTVIVFETNWGVVLRSTLSILCFIGKIWNNGHVCGIFSVCCWENTLKSSFL